MKKKSVVTPSRRHVHALFAGLPCLADVAFEKGSARARRVRDRDADADQLQTIPRLMRKDRALRTKVLSWQRIMRDFPIC